MSITRYAKSELARLPHDDDDRVRRIVDESIESLRQELYQTYGIEEVN